MSPLTGLPAAAHLLTLCSMKSTMSLRRKSEWHLPQMIRSLLSSVSIRLFSSRISFVRSLLLLSLATSFSVVISRDWLASSIFALALSKALALSDASSSPSISSISSVVFLRDSSSSSISCSPSASSSSSSSSSSNSSEFEMWLLPKPKISKRKMMRTCWIFSKNPRKTLI